MSATRQVINSLNPVRPKATSLEIERENFEKGQQLSISKAINDTECPVKEKHVRRLVLGTHQTRSSLTFWDIVRRTPLQGNPIVCWKFCHVLHKLLRDGHSQTIIDSYRFRGMLIDLGKLWGHLKEAFGKLIHSYCNLLVRKINFHANYGLKFPGNLVMSDEQLDQIGDHESRVNVFFQLACDIFDYLEDILTLQATIFASVDPARGSSMMTAVQCRLAPLIPMIQDSSHLYDYSVKILFKLHKALPPGTLDGHRNRFNAQFRVLKTFYMKSSQLQYFKNLVQVPALPDCPPNFFHQSELQSHVTPIVTVASDNDDSPNGSEVTDTLIDLSHHHPTVPPPPNTINDTLSVDSISLRSYPASEHSMALSSASANGFGSQIEEKNRMINRLTARINELHNEMQTMKMENDRTNESLRKHILDLESSKVDQVRNLNQLKTEKESIQRELDEIQQELYRHKQGTNTEAELESARKNYSIMKEAYSKMRTEHLELLRSKGELEKQAATQKVQLQEMVKSKENLEIELRSVKNNELSMQENSERLQEMMMKNESLETMNKKLLGEMVSIQTEKSEMRNQIDSLNLTLDQMKQSIKSREKSLQEDLLKKCWHFLLLVVEEAQSIERKSSRDENNFPLLNGPSSTSPCLLNCSPEYFFVQCETLSHHLEKLIQVAPSLYLPPSPTGHTCSDPSSSGVVPKFDELIQLFIRYSNQLGYLFSCGRTIEQSLPNIELGQELMKGCRDLVHLSIELCEEIKMKKDTTTTLGRVSNSLSQIIELKKRILPELAIDISKDIGDQLKQELLDMENSIKEAATKIKEMLEISKKKDTGIKLEVNENVLTSCTTLMEAIFQLIIDSKKLQEEIISQGKGSASVTEFYQRNHRWTEGLISAAKVVAVAAKLLVDAADKVVSGKGKLSELMAASHEIAAATAQLVVASRVKADPKSEKLSRLSASSKLVTESTASVVATAEKLSFKLDETDSVDFSRLNLHQAKKMEFESQVKLIELQTSIEKEQLRLASLRKKHYQLAGSSEGW